mmetsp:Transcript_48408/g.105368  ORF Transcript_48408/g.105368 Transcript_48408/m.105368 type:complete len:376 (-) Transcript_48408:72-1199(-)
MLSQYSSGSLTASVRFVRDETQPMAHAHRFFAEQPMARAGGRALPMRGSRQDEEHTRYHGAMEIGRTKSPAPELTAHKSIVEQVRFHLGEAGGRQRSPCRLTASKESREAAMFADAGRLRSQGLAQRPTEGVAAVLNGSGSAEPPPRPSRGQRASPAPAVMSKATHEEMRFETSSGTGRRALSPRNDTDDSPRFGPRKGRASPSPSAVRAPGSQRNRFFNGGHGKNTAVGPDGAPTVNQESRAAAEQARFHSPATQSRVDSHPAQRDCGNYNFAWQDQDGYQPDRLTASPLDRQAMRFQPSPRSVGRGGIAREGMPGRQFTADRGSVQTSQRFETGHSFGRSKFGNAGASEVGAVLIHGSDASTCASRENLGGRL